MQRTINQIPRSAAFSSANTLRRMRGSNIAWSVISHLICLRWHSEPVDLSMSAVALSNRSSGQWSQVAAEWDHLSRHIRQKLRSHSHCLLSIPGKLRHLTGWVRNSLSRLAPAVGAKATTSRGDGGWLRQRSRSREDLGRSRRVMERIHVWRGAQRAAWQQQSLSLPRCIAQWPIKLASEYDCPIESNSPPPFVKSRSQGGEQAPASYSDRCTSITPETTAVSRWSTRW